MQSRKWKLEDSRLISQQTNQSAAESCNVSAEKSLNMQLKTTFDSTTFDLKIQYTKP